MRNLRFIELILLSKPDRAARRVKFHPRSTVIKGENSTGKSSILKSLYSTLGAEPAVVHDKWRDAHVITSLRFSINSVRYRMIRSGSRYSLFDADDALIGSYVSVTNELSPVIADLFSFRLLLRSSSKSVDVQATPAFLFLPFYIDQDAGWIDTLNSFGRLKQFKSPKADVLAFHFGVKPSEYYAAKSRLAQADADAQPFRQERETLARVLAKLEQELQIADFNLDLDAFRDEVDRLLSRCEQLRQEEQRLRVLMAGTYATLAAVNDQIKLTRGALDELRADREHAASLPGEQVRCPTCHAEYENNFAERFSIAVDEDRCISLLDELDEEKRKAQRDYDNSRQQTERARALVEEVDVLLNAQRQQLVLQDVFRSEGRREMRQVIDKQLKSLDDKITTFLKLADDARADMRKYTDKKRKERIEDDFRGDFSRLLQRLEVFSLPPSSLRRPDAKIRETGSNLSRAILAHVFASMRTINTHSTCAMCPLVIDSPRQQEQDDANWERIRDVINKERPEGSQMVLALGNDGGTDFGGDVITLTDEYAVLQKDKFDEAQAELMPLIELSLRSDDE